MKFHVHLGPGSSEDDLISHDEQTGVIEHAESSDDVQPHNNADDSASDVRFLSDDSAVS